MGGKTSDKKDSAKVNEKNDKEVEIEMKEENKELDLLKEQMEEMKKLMLQLSQENSLLKNAALQAKTNIVLNKEEDEVTIGCRSIQGIGFGSSQDSAGEINLKYGEEKTVTVSDMKKFFRSGNVKKLFIDGICYFVNPEDYEKFGIKSYLDLSEERLKELFSKEINDIVGELNKITEDQRNINVVNCLIFRLCEMVKDRKINLDYYVRKGIEDYFGYTLDKGIILLNGMLSLK